MDLQEEARNTEVSHCTNVVDGKLEWDSSLERSEYTYIYIYSQLPIFNNNFSPKNLVMLET